MFSLKNISIVRGIGRRLLLWFSIFFLIPLLAVGYLGYQQSQKAIRKQVYDHFDSLLNLQREALLNYLHQKELQLKTSVAENDFLFISTVVLQSTTFSKGDILAAQSKTQKYLVEKNQEMGSKTLWILGREGKVIASSNPEMIGEDHKKSPQSVNDHANLASLKSHYIESPSGPEILIFAPIKSGNSEFFGIMTMSINMDDIYRILKNRSGLGKTGETYLVNSKGWMISPSRFLDQVVLKKRIHLEQLFQQRDWKISGRYPLNYQDVPVIQSYTRFPSFGWTLIGEMGTSEAFHELIVQRNRTILIVIILFSFLVITAAIISGNLTEPIRVLVQAAKRVAEGNLDYQIVSTSQDELGDLAFEFNRMTESLRISKQKMEEWNATIQQEVEIRTEAFKKSELKYRNLMEKANDAILIFNTETQRCTMANLKAEILTGYNQDEILSFGFFDFFLPENIDQVRKYYEEALNAGSAKVHNISMQRKDGRLVFVDISYSLIDLIDQNLIHCILHDVTEQRRMQMEREALFENSDIIARTSDLNLIIQNSLENILQKLEVEVSVLFLYNNEMNELKLAFQKGFSSLFEEKFGRQIVTENSKRLCVKTAYTREMQYLQNPFEGDMKSFLQNHLFADDLQTVVSLPLISEEILVGVLEIITHRKRRFGGESFLLLEALANQLAAGILRVQLEQGKHQDDQFLASILTDSVDAIISMDGEDRITSWNRGAEKIFGLHKERALGQSFTTLFHDPSLINQEKIRHELEVKGFMKDYELVDTMNDGRKVILHISQTAIRDQSGAFIGSSAIIRDITEQKEMQEQIERSEKLSSVGQLAAGIAHEIGTPLNIISGNAEYLMMDLEKKDTKMEELSIIIQQTERITKLIKQLMDFARDTQPSLEETDIHHVIDNSFTLIRHQLKSKSIEFIMSRNSAVPNIVADPHQLQQVFLNLMINAVQAMPNGGTLSVQTAIDNAEESVRIQIRDTGTGIGDEDIKNIFNPFFTTKDVGQGTGLGLAVSHRIIENHKGKIEVESKLKQGTCFTITLPLNSEES